MEWKKPTQKQERVVFEGQKAFKTGKRRGGGGGICEGMKGGKGGLLAVGLEGRGKSGVE